MTLYHGPLDLPITGGSGILGPPIYDVTKANSADQDFDVDLSGFQTGGTLRMSLTLRSIATGNAGVDETRLAINSDTTDAHYDYAVFVLGGSAFPDNSRRWSNVPNADMDADIWCVAYFEIIGYASAFKHVIRSEAMTGPKGAPEYVEIANRHHVAAAVTNFNVATLNNKIQVGSRLVIWQE